MLGFAYLDLCEIVSVAAHQAESLIATVRFSLSQRKYQTKYTGGTSRDKDTLTAGFESRSGPQIMPGEHWGSAPVGQGTGVDKVR